MIESKPLSFEESAARAALLCAMEGLFPAVPVQASVSVGG